MKVLVAAAVASRQEVIELELPEGSTVADALERSRLIDRFPELAQAETGLWGRIVSPSTLLREADRVELYRPVSADAKAMRRERAALRASRRPRSGP